MENKFIDNILKQAYEIAKDTNSKCDLRHVLLAYFKDEFCQKIFGELLIKNLENDIKKSLENGVGVDPIIGQFKKLFFQYINYDQDIVLYKLPRIKDEEKQSVQNYVALTSCFLTFEETSLQKILSNNNLTPARMASILKSYLYKQNKNENNKINGFNKMYCCVENISLKVLDENFIVNRTSESNTIRQFLIRKEKNSVLLLGDNGIGKKKILEKVALDCIKSSDSHKFIRYDISSLVGIDKYKNDFMMSIDSIIQSIQNDKLIIPIFDISSYIPELDIIALLIPFLKEKRPTIIITTDEISRQMLENNSYIKCFNVLRVKELELNSVFEILNHLKSEYETFYNIQITTENLNNLLTLSEKVLNNRKFPEKAIDVLDCVCSYCKFNGKNNINDFDIKHTIAQLLNVSEDNIYDDNSIILRNLKNSLMDKIKGQDNAINEIVESIYISQTGLRESSKTSASLFFIGKTAVGKTECCRVLSKELNLPLVRFDMSEYMESHSISKLLGSPPGYKDSGDGKSGNGLLINAISENPKCILLLDEIEKAHPKVHNLLLQIMDNGCITSSIGKKVYFDNVLLIMTSNVGATSNSTFGFVKQDTYKENKEYNEQFLPEFRSRIDKVIYFEDLNNEVMIQICHKFLKELNELLKPRKIKLYYGDDIVQKIIKDINEGGARGIKNYITNNIKNVIAKDIIFGKYKENIELEIKIKQNIFVVDRKEQPCC